MSVPIAFQAALIGHAAFFRNANRADIIRVRVGKNAPHAFYLEPIIDHRLGGLGHNPFPPGIAAKNIAQFSNAALATGL